jgi:uncharacterized protein (TIGR02444 family)
MQRSLWDFSNAVYAAAGVAEECLGLQDRCVIDVNLLLFCGYMGAGGVLLSQDDLRQVSELLRAWHEDVVRPLRAARRALKIRYGSAFMPVVEQRKTCAAR